jgi:hypothetical protein
MILTHNLIRYWCRILRNRPRCAAKFRTDRQTHELRVKRSIRILCWAWIAQSVQRLDMGRTVQGSNPGGSEFFRTVQVVPGAPPSLLYNKYQERGFHHLPLSRTEIEERAELYLFSPSGPSWPVLGLMLPLYFIHVFYIWVRCLFLFVAFISFFICFRV